MVFLVNKPKDWTSFDVVKKIRGNLRLKKVGHAGTLDPLATGLLIICSGKKTKEIESFMGQEKEYTGVISFGKTTPSYDLETEFDGEYPTEHIKTEDLENARTRFVGAIKQIPPHFSALKVKGQKAYDLARQGKKAELKEREVAIREFELDAVDFPDVKFRVSCSKGTYIRSLAHDLGKALDSGAYLKELKRIRIGEFELKDAMEIDELIKKYKNEDP